MLGITVDQVRATDVADLAASLLGFSDAGFSDAGLLAADAESAEAVVAAAQRVISAVTAVQVVAIEAWGRREGEQLKVDRAEWNAMAQERMARSGGVNGARLRLLDGVPNDEHDFMPSYLAPVLRLSPRSARRRYETARVLAGSLPQTLAAMRAGDLEPHRAQQIVDEVPPDNHAVCAAVERALFPRIVDKPTTRVGQLTRKAVAAADPAATAQKAEQAQKRRFVCAGPSGLPGLMRFEAEVDAGKGRQVWAAIEELAASYIKEGVATTVDQARADAFVDLVLANANVTTVVDLALPAGFAAAGPGQGASCAGCGLGVDFSADRWAPRARAHGSGDSQADDFRGAGVGAGGSVVEDTATGVLVDADQATGQDLGNRQDRAGSQHGADRQDRVSGQGGAGQGFLRGTRHQGSGSGPPTLVRDGPVRDGPVRDGPVRDGPVRDGPVRDGGHGNVLRLLAGLPIAGVLDHRVGSLTPATIERILADPDTVFRRLVIDPDTGWLLDVGATTYQPGRHLARTVRKRDLHCRFPGCATAARFCDLDHVTPFPVGLTVMPNLACLCRRHHRLKTHGHWSLTMDADGVCTWVDRRTGQVHTTEPADYRELAV